jgi:ribosomal protein L11 methyltransferase
MFEILKKEICRVVCEDGEKVPVGDLVRMIARRFHLPGASVRESIRQLVRDEVLKYTNQFGTSLLEPSFDRPVRVSDRIVIKPPRKSHMLQPKDVVIELEQGAAFGQGAHPTTRLALGAMDRALRFLDTSAVHPSVGLDVGTGTGILAIALAKLGVEKVLGTDIDPCAIFEARHNVVINGLSHRVMVLDVPLETLTGGYMAVCANLAFPTIKGMASCLVDLTAPGGVIILSGFRASMVPSVRQTFEPYGVVLDAESVERNWACTTWLKKRA